MENSPKRKSYHIFFFFVRDDSRRNTIGLLSRTKVGLYFFLFLSVAGFFILKEPTQLETNGRLTKGGALLKQNREHSMNDTARAQQEVRHIAFLKVHKAASSTLQNIFFRFGLKRNLTQILPVKGNKFSVSSKEHLPILDPPKGKWYSILAVHAVFNLKIFSTYLPADAAYIAIIRDPLDVMISSAFYNRDAWNIDYLKRVPKENFIQNLIRYPEKYDKEEFSLTKNPMAADFGFPSGLTESGKVERYVQYLGTLFNLVLIVEHFSESLILMKRFLGWSLASVVYIPINDHEHPSISELGLNETDKRLFQKRNHLDYQIYQYFYDLFIEKLSIESDDFFEEVKHFDRVQTNIRYFCLSARDAEPSRSYFVGHSPWNGPFRVSKRDCDLMAMTELDFIDKLRGEYMKKLYDDM